MVVSAAAIIFMVALAQGAEISTAIPNPDGSKASQSMGTGGSLSCTGISVWAGVNGRFEGIFADSRNAFCKTGRTLVNDER